MFCLYFFYLLYIEQTNDDDDGDDDDDDVNILDTRQVRNVVQVCALNGYSCVDTEYAWYQQQQKQQHVSPYTGVLMAPGADVDNDNVDNTTTFIHAASLKPVLTDYCPSCFALYAAEADAAASVVTASDVTTTG